MADDTAYISDFGIALKNNVYYALIEKAKKDEKLRDDEFRRAWNWALNVASLVVHKMEGTLIVLNGVSSSDFYGGNIGLLMGSIREFDLCDWYICEACSEDPSPHNIWGGWSDNPWKLGLLINVSLTYVRS